MKKHYYDLKMEIIPFDSEDVITNSPNNSYCEEGDACDGDEECDDECDEG